MPTPKPSGFWLSRSKWLAYLSGLQTIWPTALLPSKLLNLPGPASGIPRFCAKAYWRLYAGICSETNRGSSKRDWFELAVADSGIGMTAEQQAKLFQDFTLILAVLTGRTL